MSFTSFVGFQTLLRIFLKAYFPRYPTFILLGTMFFTLSFYWIPQLTQSFTLSNPANSGGNWGRFSVVAEETIEYTWPSDHVRTSTIRDFQWTLRYDGNRTNANRSKQRNSMHSIRGCYIVPRIITLDIMKYIGNVKIRNSSSTAMRYRRTV